MIVAAAVAAVAAVILGEYTFTGLLPWLAGLIVPAAVGESAALVAGHQRPWLWLLTAVAAGTGVAWGVWLSTGRGLDPWPAGGWVAVALAAVAPLVVAAVAVRRGERAPAGRLSSH